VVQLVPTRRKLDVIDEKIVWQLRREARISNNELAARVNVSPSTALMRVRALWESGVLRSAHVQYDMNALGLHLQAVVFVRLKPGAQGRIGAYAARAIKLASVVNIFVIGSNYDLLIHVACASSNELRDLIATQLAEDPDVAATQAHIVFEHLIGAQHMDHVKGFTAMRGSVEEAENQD
jgi:DNA-binding Lrp family transcriptional regulator